MGASGSFKFAWLCFLYNLTANNQDFILLLLVSLGYSQNCRAQTLHLRRRLHEMHPGVWILRREDNS